MKKIMGLTLAGVLTVSSVGMAYANPITDAVKDGANKALDVKNEITKNVVDISLDTLGDILDSIKDIQNHWAEKFIATLVHNDIIGGYPDGTFKPDNQISIAEFSKIVSTTIGEDVGNSSDGNWYDNYIVDLMSRDIIQEDEFYNYNRHITRGEMARIVVRALDEGPREGETELLDDRRLSEEFKGYIKTATDLGIINGHPHPIYPENEFKEKDLATRAETSKIINQMIEVIKDKDNWKAPEVVNENVEKPQDANAYIKPKIIVDYNDGFKDGYSYFGIEIENFRAFNDEYDFSIECINYPELNERQMPMPSGKFSEVDDLSETKNYSELISGRLYGLPSVYYTSQKYINKFSIEEGMKIDFVVTVKNGNEKKEYPISVTIKEEWERPTY